MQYTLSAAALLAVLAAIYMTSLFGYLLFHSLVEGFSIVIGCAIFMVVWNARKLLQNHYLLFIGIAYLYVAGIDFLHTLTYKGMGVFEGYGANLPTQLWITGQYLQALSLLIAAIFLHRKLAPRWTLAAYGLLTGLVLAAIFYWKIFPDCFTEGVGLTPFKIYSEYVICLILLGAMGLLIKNSKDFNRYVLILLIASMAIAVAQELAFTDYLSVYGPLNMIGHLLKIVSFYLLYKAIIQTSLVSPWNVLFRNLKQSEQALRQSRDTLQAVLDAAPAGMMVAEASGCILLANAATQSIFGSPLMTNDQVSQGDYRISRLDGAQIAPDQWPLSLALTGRNVADEEILVTRADGTQAIILANATPLRTDGGKTWGAVMVFQNITERKRAEAELQILAQQRQLALNAARMGWWHYDPITRIASWDQRYKEIFGVTGYERPNDEILARLHPEDLPGVWAKVEAALDPVDPQTYSAEYRINLPDGSISWIEAHGIASFEGVGENRQATSFVGTVADITERKRAEQVLRESEERLRASLEEKEILLKEIHHRVKNNMQVISSLVALHADDLQNPAMRSVLLDVTHRVRSMAMVHEKLYQSADLARVEFGEYVRSLLNYLWRAHGHAASGVRLALDLEPVSLPVNAAVPCGLILNELISNALKHAFRGGNGGEVAVSLRGGASDSVHLSVRDNGMGLPAGFNWRQSRSLGLRLVQMLAGQLHASVEVSDGGGTDFKVRFGRSDV